MNGADGDQQDALLDRLLREELGFGVGGASARVREAVEALAAMDGTDAAAVLESVCADRRDPRRSRIVEAATVQHTGFFRHREQFDEIEHRLRALRTARRFPRIWSAGCATGEEPYTLALIAAELGLSARILATDASPAAIRFARAGQYPARRCRALPDGAEGWQAPPSLRRMIQFEIGSLVDARPTRASGPFDLIVCRNVLLYFDRADASRLLGLLSRHLGANGAMVVAPAETLIPLPDGLAAAGPPGFLERGAPRRAPTPRPQRTVPELPCPLERAAHALGADDAESAERLLRRWLDARPRDGRGWFLLGEALRLRGERAQARAAFEQCVALARDQPEDDAHGSLAAAARRLSRSLG